jgi:hypothetical protein
LVNPWVSRMNSSANRISPIGLRKQPRVADFPNLPGAGRLGIRPGQPPLRAGICRQWTGLCKAQSSSCDRAARQPSPQLVELRERLSRLQRFRAPVHRSKTGFASGSALPAIERGRFHDAAQHGATIEPFDNSRRCLRTGILTRSPKPPSAETSLTVDAGGTRVLWLLSV